MDFDNDGFLDVSVTAAGKTTILRNVDGTLAKGKQFDSDFRLADVQNRGWADALLARAVDFDKANTTWRTPERQACLLRKPAMQRTSTNSKVDLLGVSADSRTLARNTSAKVGPWLRSDAYRREERQAGARVARRSQGRPGLPQAGLHGRAAARWASRTSGRSTPYPRDWVTE
ncbi:MAG: VCBS repeat-containing protein [Bryobacterales bacterium]